MVATPKLITPVWISPLDQLLYIFSGYLRFNTKLKPWSLLSSFTPPQAVSSTVFCLNTWQSVQVLRLKTLMSSLFLSHALYQFHQQILPSLSKYGTRNQPLLNSPLPPPHSKPLSFLTQIIAVASVPQSLPCCRLSSVQQRWCFKIYIKPSKGFPRHSVQKTKLLQWLSRPFTFWSLVTLLTSSPPTLPITQSSSATLAPLFLKCAKQVATLDVRTLYLMSLPSAWNSLGYSHGLSLCIFEVFAYTSPSHWCFLWPRHTQFFLFPFCFTFLQHT